MKMKLYLLSMYQPDGDPPPPEVLEPIMRDIHALEQEMKAAGVWVFSGGLPPNPAGWIITTARNRALDRLCREDRRAQAALLHERAALGRYRLVADPTAIQPAAVAGSEPGGGAQPRGRSGRGRGSGCGAGV
jgi:hypothetical protein